jgi:hypothetical protein
MTPDPYYAAALAKGQDFQDFIAARLIVEGIVLVNLQGKHGQRTRGENLLGLEIKFDDKYATTRQLWIEVMEKLDPSHRDWIPAGIDRHDNSWLYGIGNYAEFFIFSKKTLHAESRRWLIRENTRGTSRGFLLPRIRAVELADRLFAFPATSGVARHA